MKNVTVDDVKGLTMVQALKLLNDVRPRNISVPVAAEIMGLSLPFLRYALLDRRFPFGVGVKMARNGFYVNTMRFIKYMEARDMG